MNYAIVSDLLKTLHEADPAEATFVAQSLMRMIEKNKYRVFTDRNFSSLCAEMDNSAALECIDGMRDAVEDFVKYDSSRASRVAQRYYRINNGTEVELKPRRMFSDKTGCFLELGGLDETRLQAFCRIADGGSNSDD